MKPPALVIAHRGASGYLPEHTLPGYRLAIEQGADFIEPDLVSTRDGVLVARHENEIGGTTDVAAHPQFAPRRRVQPIDGVAVDGWFTEDFTHAELCTLRARERLPELRPQGARFDGQYAIPTFAEILDLLAAVNRDRAAEGRKLVGVYPETKHPGHFRALGLPLEEPLLDALTRHAGPAPVFIQSFETGNLRALHPRTSHPLVQLVELNGAPWDRRDEGFDYDALCSPEGLARVAEYASAIGVHKERVLPRDAGGRLLAATGLVRDAHAAGLAVHAWTFRAENAFLPAQLRRGDAPADHGDLGTEIRRHLDAGIDGFFADFPDIAVAARDGSTGGELDLQRRDDRGGVRPHAAP
jgi:glycerophosphoryl diester phosphodiesterase